MAQKRILVVDDEQNVLKVLDQRLSKTGYAVLKANNGEDAIFLAKKEKPDLILLDLMMPDISGADVAAALKQDPGTKNIPVIFLTCLVTKNDEEHIGRESGGNFFIAKPYEPNDLLGEIQKRISE
ncbi:MAG: response regulator [Candidatus Omnitrophica bacterium]|jgi:CheY-like chemotaxis protein|nr:response regulator [Candidatus Omnitrophota bacterium]